MTRVPGFLGGIASSNVWNLSLPYTVRQHHLFREANVGLLQWIQLKSLNKNIFLKMSSLASDYAKFIVPALCRIMQKESEFTSQKVSYHASCLHLPIK